MALDLRLLVALWAPSANWLADPITRAAYCEQPGLEEVRTEIFSIITYLDTYFIIKYLSLLVKFEIE